MNTETTSLTKPAAPQKKIDSLLALTKITVKDIEHLSLSERGLLTETLNQTAAKLKGTDRDNFYDKIAQIIPAGVKNDLWEVNHTLISNAIDELMRRNGIMPTKTKIANETGLSRQTINKHLKEYQAHPEFAAQMEEFKFMAPRILASVFKNAARWRHAGRQALPRNGWHRKQKAKYHGEPANQPHPGKQYHPEPGKPKPAKRQATQPDRKDH